MVNDSIPAKVANVPVVGNVTLVLAVEVKVVVKAPDVVRFPPIVIVLSVFATPVPPLSPEIISEAIAKVSPPIETDNHLYPPVTVWIGEDLLVVVLSPL